MDQQFAAAHILGLYQRAGGRFDGIYRVLPAHLRENRQADPQPSAYARLAADISRLGFTDYENPAPYWPNLVVDGSVLMSFARLDNEAVGAALIEAVADRSCQVIVSPLAYQRIAAELSTFGGAGLRLHGFLPRLTLPPLTFPQVEVITGLDTGERLDAMHTVLLALHYRCVIGTLEPEIYHRIGYGRVLNLGA